MKSQLAGLRHRAAVRANKVQQKSSTSEAKDVPDVGDLSSQCPDQSEVDFIDTSEAPADSGSNSAPQKSFDNGQSRAETDTRRRIALNGTNAKSSVTKQLAGLRRKAKITNGSSQNPHSGRS